MSRQDKACSACNGSGITKPDGFIGKILSKDKYQPLECQRCRGSGKERK
ncbi:hypothetical protein ABF162_23200 [Vibrio coralliilyticus]|nr:hypothetical protein [Vibrio coralliilyticus]